MSWGDELKVIRRFLRDPSATIWTDDYLRHMWNDVQQDFQHKTSVLEDVVAQEFPGTYQYAYLFDWEYRYLPDDESQFYQALNVHDDGVFCHRWETQQRAGISADVADYGAHFIQPWEACMSETPGDTIKLRFPANLNEMKYAAYNQEPLDALTKKQVQSWDASYVTKQGDPRGYYAESLHNNSYVLYPRPPVVFNNELSGEGMALFGDGDTDDTSTGVVATRYGTVDVTTETGMPIDIVDTDYSVFMVYEVSPADVVQYDDEPEYPAFMRKYIRFGVIARAYAANTDGRIRSVADLWASRYGLGVQFVKRFMSNRRQDRDYRLTTKIQRPRRRFRHPRLPDAYPVVGN